MECLKCGSPVPEDQVFCSKCLRSAAAAPVRADIRVALPQHRDPSARKLLPKPPKPEEVIAGLEQTIHRLTIAVTVLAVLLTIAVGCAGFIVYREFSTPQIGENYNTVSTE